ncbi:MAG TPA: nucleotidyl transferase AbiEii/AbiGii toxin family protein [Gemmataceae bacterium]|jgi:hypothetical protein|nr:nucleotidyl transferase AbiEii/AbiGii toxin family protein [Gemmataceae bacterium]
MAGRDCDELRHRLLEGVLLRLARLTHAESFALRGGMLMRLWFRPVPRPAADLDLVALFPFDVDETRRRFAPLLADRGVDDGVALDPERFRVEGIWQNTDFPGVRVHAAGDVGGTEVDFQVDVTFGEPLDPPPVAGDYAMAHSPHAARLRMCRPETIVGRKLHALYHMGRMHWRAKDLNDLRLLTTRVPLDTGSLAGAIASSFTSRGDAPADARRFFAREWWALKRSAARWHEFALASPDPDVPRNLPGVVAAVAARLGPTLDRLS